MAARKTKARRTTSSKRDSYCQHMLGDVGARASTFAEASKHVVTERLTELASATKDFTSTVEGLPYLRDYTDAAAKRIDEFARYVKRTDIPEILDDIGSFAKRQPMATLALSMAAGLVTTQLMRGGLLRRDSSGAKRSARKANKRRAHR